MRRPFWQMVFGMMLVGSPGALADPQPQSDEPMLPPASLESPRAHGVEAADETRRMLGERVAYFPESTRLDEDERRLWDEALRTELARLGVVLLPDEERELHVRSARTLGLGCQLDTSPACLAFLSELATLSHVLVATGSEDRMRLLRLGLRAGELIELGRGEVDHPAPGSSHAEAASALVAQTFLDAALRSADSTQRVHSDDSETPGMEAHMGVTDAHRDPNTSESGPLAEAMPAETPGTLAPALGGHPALLFALVGSGMVMGGGASLAASQWLSHTPFEGAMPSSERVKDHLAWVDATQWAGVGLLGVGVSVGVAGAVLGLAQEGVEE